MSFNLVQIGCGAGVLGVFSHLCYFIHGEHHQQAFEYFVALVTFPFLAIALQIGLNVDWIQGLRQTAVLYSSFLTGLYFSLFIYRAFFHRLHSFPGPFGAKISKLWHVWKVAPTIDNYKHLSRLHAEYGSFVRTGTVERKIK